MIKIEDTQEAAALAASEFGPPTWYCYLVVHPITRAPIYAGMTSDIIARRQAHTGTYSRIRARLGKLGEVDFVPEVVIVGRYETKEEALNHEVRLIKETPGLLNERSDRAAGRPRIGEEHKTIEANKPWVEAGVSRSTWFRRQSPEQISWFRRQAAKRRETEPERK
jgi:predicted GIY-YIG superfamily endonuclease